MRIFVYFCIGVAMGAGLLLAFAKANARPNVLAEQIESPTVTPIPTPKPTPTTRPSPKATAGTATKKPTPKPTPRPEADQPLADTATPIPAPTATSQEINGFIDRFSAQYHVDPNVLRHTAICESGFNPGATNGSYVGLFQFGPITWQKYRNLMGEDANSILRANAEEAVQTAAYVYSIGASRIWPNCVPGS